MTTIQEIEKALKKLPQNRLIEFREWYEKFDAEQWDQQFEQDAMDGKLDKLANEALTHFDDDACTEL